MITLAVVTLDANSLIPLGSVGVVAASAFWFGRQLQHIKDRMSEGDRRFDRLEKATQEQEGTLKSVEAKLTRVETLVNGAQQKMIEAAVAATHAATLAAQQAQVK